MNPSREVLASANRHPGQISWDYDRAEIIADGAVHAIGVCLGLIGAVTIVVIAVKMERIEITPILIYVIGLVTMLALSAAYNMWPVSPAKWVLRRFDHSAIYLLIAGTYTPFLAKVPDNWVHYQRGDLFSVSYSDVLRLGGVTFGELPDPWREMSQILRDHHSSEHTVPKTR